MYDLEMKSNSTYLSINNIDIKWNTMTTLECQLKTRNSSIISKDETFTKPLCFSSFIFTHMKTSKHPTSSTYNGIILRQQPPARSRLENTNLFSVQHIIELGHTGLTLYLERNHECWYLPISKQLNKFAVWLISLLSRATYHWVPRCGFQILTP